MPIFFWCYLNIHHGFAVIQVYLWVGVISESAWLGNFPVEYDSGHNFLCENQLACSLMNLYYLYHHKNKAGIYDSDKVESTIRLVRSGSCIECFNRLWRHHHVFFQ